MSLVLQSSGGGSVTISEPSTASSYTATLPAGTGTIAVQGASTNIVSGTAVTASGASIDFTGIPSWAKRVTVMFSGISTNGTSSMQVQVGSGSVTTTGYVTTYGYVVNAAATGTTTSTTGFTLSAVAAANTTSGQFIITNISSNTWVCSATLSGSSTILYSCSSIALSGVLDRVRITTVNGTDAFDAGTINILYE